MFKSVKEKLQTAAFVMKHVTVLKTSLGAVTAAHTIRDSTWKLCIIWLFPIPMWPEWLKAGGTGILWSLGSPEAAHHSERPIKFLLPVTVSKFSLCLVPKRTCLFWQVQSSQYHKGSCCCPFLRLLTGLWREELLQVRKAWLQGDVFALILHILSPDSR